MTSSDYNKPFNPFILHMVKHIKARLNNTYVCTTMDTAQGQVHGSIQIKSAHVTTSIAIVTTLVGWIPQVIVTL